ncbi:PAS domain-containing protein [Spirosoma utsteinense]|uniref:PAS domain S-box-containing protein n=1 Tax=Spirosoma utsteinense TaxID=2585773 RepID=A0ABR6WCS1_9BACT|nr:PAS domain-containing protein [Spirosoma utsteinense]MBC3788374.1 PAS domain S-box-containing protein [Spirosoma utsteinense]MBC3794362.1 PAS domain S-box-containing protein [Spirosoma utsteinense]
MLSSESYIELVNRGYSRAQQHGNRPYPVASYEIFMLDQAQHRAKRKEAAVFQALSDIFDWKLPRQQRNGYLKKLGTGSTLVLTDQTKTILWTSNSFLAMTGFTRAESIGRTPGILQGPGTDRATLLTVRDSIRHGSPIKADLLNYRKNGESYLCRVSIDPLFSHQGELTHFLAVENEVR